MYLSTTLHLLVLVLLLQRTPVLPESQRLELSLTLLESLLAALVMWPTTPVIPSKDKSRYRTRKKTMIPRSTRRCVEWTIVR